MAFACEVSRKSWNFIGDWCIKVYGILKQKWSKFSSLVIRTFRILENESFEKAMRRFRRKVEREGIRKDIKKNSFYLKPGEKKRLKQRLAEKRRRKAMRRSRIR